MASTRAVSTARWSRSVHSSLLTSVLSFRRGACRGRHGHAPEPTQRRGWSCTGCPRPPGTPPGTAHTRVSPALRASWRRLGADVVRSRGARDRRRSRRLGCPSWHPRRRRRPAAGDAEHPEPQGRARGLRRADEAADHRAAAADHRAGHVPGPAGRAAARPGVATVVGGTLSAGSANALNCVYDADIDERMRRTRRRALPAAHRDHPRRARLRPGARGGLDAVARPAGQLAVGGRWPWRPTSSTSSATR